MERMTTPKEKTRQETPRRRLDPKRMFRSRRHWEVQRGGSVERLRLKAEKEAC